MRASHRRLVATALLAASAATALFGVGPASVADPVPVLWQGKVEAAGGQAADSTVVAYARPAAHLIKPGDEMLPVAMTTTDGAGNFTLRALPSALNPVADAAGWATVMVVATSPQGMALAVDSIAWRPDRLSAADGLSATDGQWVSTPAGLAAGADRLVEPADLRSERPTTLVLSDQAPAANVPLAKAPAGHPRCVATRAVDQGVKAVRVGELHRERDWAGEFTYTNTKSTSFQIGVSPDGSKWKVGGSVSRDQGGKFGGAEPATDHLVYKHYLADMQFTRFTWRCGEPYWYDTMTLEPVSWTGGMTEVAGTNAPACSGRFLAPVPATKHFIRDEGTSSTLQGAISMPGFTGSVTSTVSKAATYRWDNMGAAKRYLCGEQDFPNAGNSRVSARP